jgi:Cys-tRNA(Pro)/Cys-tRNA(Cys) deacylase
MSYAGSNRVTSPQTHTYATDIRSADDVAHVLGIPAYEVYQTLVVLPPHGKPLLMIIPGPWALDLERLAQALGTKRPRMATHPEAEALTGLQEGGMSALAVLDRGFQVYVEQAAQTLTTLVVSAGQRGYERTHARRRFHACDPSQVRRCVDRPRRWAITSGEKPLTRIARGRTLFGPVDFTKCLVKIGGRKRTAFKGFPTFWRRRTPVGARRSMSRG